MFYIYIHVRIQSLEVINCVIDVLYKRFDIFVNIVIRANKYNGDFAG